MPARTETSDVFVLLLRGINVGGHNKLPMATLRELLACLGAENVATYIQSGNAVFSLGAKEVKTCENKLSARIEKEFGFSPDLFMLDRAAYLKILKQNPYKLDEAEGKKLHVAFLTKPASKTGLDKVKEALVDGEDITSKGKVLYFYAPNGVGRSKAAEKLNAAFSDGTMRNWRTCLKLAEMVEAL
ncbi:MAG: hypothetical protein DHS20C05_10970 [Hyphococcus sp.]|nr:MAG: hypothetical protein DHS20C05_10970 [Marinicaulis sp.]